MKHSALKTITWPYQAEINLDEIERPLKNYRFLRGPRRQEIDEFISMLPEPYKTFAVMRYLDGFTMERIAEKMNYSTRNMYCFRQKILEWWAIFAICGEIDAVKGKTNGRFLSH